MVRVRPVQSVGRVAVALLAVLAWAGPALAGALPAAGAPMSFSLRQADSCPAAGCVAATGMIAPGTAGEFQRFLKANRVVTGTLIELDSTGGDVIGALKLGLIIRRNHLNTRVRAPDAGNGTLGMCASACAYVFVAGVERGIEDGARVGVHQFSPNRAAQDTSDAQRTVGLISVYLEAVGANPKLEQLALLTPPDKVRWLSGAEVAQMGVTTGGEMQIAQVPPWQLPGAIGQQR